MVPIQELLHRIRWDPGFRTSVFEIGYVDRVAGRIVHVPVSGLRIRRGPRPALTRLDENGCVRTIPLHRVCEVRRDGALIWQRIRGS